MTLTSLLAPVSFGIIYLLATILFEPRGRTTKGLVSRSDTFAFDWIVPSDYDASYLISGLRSFISHSFTPGVTAIISHVTNAGDLKTEL